MPVSTRRMRVGCEFIHDAEVATPAVFQVTPLGVDGVSVTRERWRIEPRSPLREYRDVYSNRCHRLTLPAGRSRVAYDAVVRVPDAAEEADETAPEVAPGELPDQVLIYLTPSRYCLPDVLADEAWARFGGLPRGYRRVQAVCQYVHDHLEFAYGSSSPTSTAVDVNAAGYGVCRDFTHLAITFCRALNIPARYVFGYLPEWDASPDPSPPDFAAWMQVWLGDRWWTFDPRNNVRRKGRILIGRGRDASDVAMVTSFGRPILQSMTVIAEQSRHRGVRGLLAGRRSPSRD